MSLHLRRRRDIWPDKGWPADHYEVITDSGDSIGTILQAGNWHNGTHAWHINGDHVGHDVNATAGLGRLRKPSSGRAPSRYSAPTAAALRLAGAGCDAC